MRECDLVLAHGAGLSMALPAMGTKAGGIYSVGGPQSSSRDVVASAVKGADFGSKS